MVEKRFDSVVSEKHGKGITYFVLAKCKRCGATVTMTPKQRVECEDNSLIYLDNNIPCCEHQDYTYMF